VRPATKVLVALASALLAACSSSGNNPTAHPEAGAPDAAPDGAGKDAAAEAVPEAGGDVHDAPTEPGGVCGRIPFAEMATVTLQLPDGGMLSCANASPADAGAPAVRTWTGLVTSSDATSIVVDTCGSETGDAGTDAGSSDGDCSAPLRVEVHASGLDLARFPHVRVRLTAKVSFFRQCQRALQIMTADGAAGDAQGAAGTLLLAVNDGGDTLDGAPYGVAHVPLGCSPMPVCNGPGHAADEYALDFSDATDITHRMRVFMGDTGSWTLGASTYTLHNLRSFQSIACDDYWNWAYWIYTDPK